MPQNSWSPKRERQYAHIKDSLLERGEDENFAAEIAARTVNKERALHGETKHISAPSLKEFTYNQGDDEDFGAEGRTLAQLHKEARRRDVKGRYQMSKAQLEQALKH